MILLAIFKLDIPAAIFVKDRDSRPVGHRVCLARFGMTLGSRNRKQNIHNHGKNDRGMKILFSLLGLYLGFVLDGFATAVLGLFIGLIGAALIQAGTRVRQLETRLTALESRPASGPLPEAKPAATAEQVITAGEEPAAVEGLSDAIPVSEPARPSGSPSNSRPIRQGAAARPSVFTPFVKLLRRFLTGGNVVVKVGAVVLFFGVSFLIKYAAERELVPIELRLAGVALGAIALLGLGWHLRQRLRGYALVLQGIAIGLLYLTVFAAARLYDLLPLGPAFAVLFMLVLLSALMAVLQNARALAFFATAGGFLAPVLTSTGEGSHVQLFSYYLLLNLGIVGIAWFRAWRELNLLGFVFTFVIASLWGWRYYQPGYFNSTEPFLILFFLFYLVLPILFALRQPPKLKGLVDGTLVFGVPLLAFALQSAMVEDMAFGAAWSAAGASAIYLVSARLLWQFGYPHMRLLTEALLALGILFASLVVPLALDGNWTAAVWSLEGAALVWVGIRQQRLYARLFGLLLQIGAAGAFVFRAAAASADIPLLNSAWIGSVLISLGGFAVGYLYHRYRLKVHAREQPLSWMLLGWALGWWLAAGLVEIDRFVPGIYEANAALLLITFTALLLPLLKRGFDWPLLYRPPLLLLPAMLLLWLWLRIDQPYDNPFAAFGWIAWPLAVAAHFLSLYICERHWPNRSVQRWHQAGAVFVVYLIAWALNDGLTAWLGRDSAWSQAVWAVPPLMTILLLPHLARYLDWPLQQHRNSYLGLAQWPLHVWLSGWILWACTLKASPAPLPYLPLFNPVEILQVLSLLVLLRFIMQPGVPRRTGWMALLGGLAFLVFNVVIARAVHVYAGIAFAPEPLLESGVFHAAISILWTGLALIIMSLGARSGRRTVWFIGSGLLAAVVLKLFTVDLADIGAMTRIVSFISVGVLILLIGYLAPVPPKEPKAIAS